MDCLQFDVVVVVVCGRSHGSPLLLSRKRIGLSISVVLDHL
jgi:hypothetical protein